MTLAITPGEFNIFNDRYVIKTRCQMDKITDEMLISRVRNANLSAGDAVTVQCFNHEFDTLLYQAEYVVYGRTEALRTHEVNDREIRQINDITFRLARVGDWWASPAGQETVKATPADLTAGVKVVWNVGNLSHDVVAADGTVLAAFTKEHGGKVAAEAYLANPTAKAA